MNFSIFQQENGCKIAKAFVGINCIEPVFWPIFDPGLIQNC